jgi:hypothetical protein
MKQTRRRLAMAACGITTALVLAFGVQTAYGSAIQGVCPDPSSSPWVVGTCPPWTPESCDDYCDYFFGNGSTECAGGCCICIG